MEIILIIITIRTSIGGFDSDPADSRGDLRAMALVIVSHDSAISGDEERARKTLNKRKTRKTC